MPPLVEQASLALQEGDWEAARDAYATAIEAEAQPEALFGLGTALWWLGDLDATMRRYEEAYALARRTDRPDFAAVAAVRLGFHSMAHLANEAAAAGWLRRAERLINEYGLDAARGDLLLMKATCANDPLQAEAWAREALELAQEAGDPDLELCAISQVGASAVEQGRIQEGLALLDEAMAGSLGGEPRHLETVVFTGCNMMTCCAQCAALKRAMDWIRASERFERRYGCPFLYLECRTVYGTVLVARGEWDAAEEALLEAIDLSKDRVPTYFAEAIGALAELRLSQGRIEEAGRLLEGTDGKHATVPAHARLNLLKGQPGKAAAEVRRRLDLIGADQLASSRLLELLGEAEIAEGQVERALERGRAMVRRGEKTGCTLAIARGHRLAGRAANDADAARRHLDAALREFTDLEMPYEAACVRLAIAVKIRDTDLAAAEARTALRMFEQLGASSDADRAAARLRELGVSASRSGPRGLEPLTERERDVLALVREGLTNSEIGGRLFISHKTVEHHVSSILGKLNVRNRAEAAAAAVRWME